MRLISTIKSKYLRKSIRIYLGLVLTCLFTLHTLNMISLPGVQLIENQLYDLKVRSSVEGQLDPRVVILDIDEKSLGEYGRWPWTRSLMATIDNKLFDEQKIAVLGYDIVWAEPDPLNFSSVHQVWSEILPAINLDDPVFKAIRQFDPDQQFADSMKGHNVVLGMYFNNEEGAVKANILPPPAITQQQLPDRVHSIHKWGAYTGNLSRITEAASMTGHFNPMVDYDGVIRRLPLLLEYEGNYYQSLSVAMTRMAIGGPPLEPIIIKHENDYEVLEGIRFGPFEIPLQKDGSAYIPFKGPAKSYEYISVKDLLSETFPKNYLENKLVIMGSTAPGLRDYRTTPMGPVFPGVEIHASMISGILDQNINQAPAYTIALVLIQIIFMGLLATFLLPIFAATITVITTCLLLGLLMMINLFFWNMQLVVPLAAPLLVICLIFIGNLGIGFFVEGRLQRQISGLFGQYVPAPLVKKMAENPKKYDMQGDELDLTVMFSDIRGFTNISEKLTPQQLTAYINEYFNTMTKIIMDHSGTLDKYIGDAIMAFWGAPITSKNHAYEAVKASFELSNAAKQLAEDFKARGLPAFRIGIGLNSGLMRVGDMGSNLRRSYTVMGDPVNLGSRLEGLTKIYGVDVIVSEDVVKRAPQFIYREIDRVKVKGKSKIVTIYEPVSEEGKLSLSQSNEIKAWSEALKDYYAQNWSGFESKLKQIRHKQGSELLLLLYKKRIAYFKKNPPAKSWGGVTAFDVK